MENQNQNQKETTQSGSQASTPYVHNESTTKLKLLNISDQFLTRVSFLDHHRTHGIHTSLELDPLCQSRKHYLLGEPILLSYYYAGDVYKPLHPLLNAFLTLFDLPYEYSHGDFFDKEQLFTPKKKELGFQSERPLSEFEASQLLCLGRALQFLYVANCLLNMHQSEHQSDLPSPQSLYGAPTLINAGNYLYFLSLNEVTQAELEELIPNFLGAIMVAQNARSQFFSWQEWNNPPSEGDYLSQVKKERGSFYRLIAQTFYSFCEQSQRSPKEPLDAYLDLADDIALQVQIQSDISNLDIPLNENATDHDLQHLHLAQNKFSLPIIVGIRSNPKDHRIQKIMKTKAGTHDPIVLRYGVTYLIEQKAVEYSKNYLTNLKTKIKAKVETIFHKVGLTDKIF